MTSLRTIDFKTAAAPWRLCVVECLRISAEQRGLRTKPTAEWLRVADLSGIHIILDLTTRTFRVSPRTPLLAELLLPEGEAPVESLLVVPQPAGHIYLSTRQVQEALERGHCLWKRDCEALAPFAYPQGGQLWVHESVAKPRKGETTYLYRADGEQPGRFYHKNFHMPHAARRLQVEVVGSWGEVSDDGQWSHCYTLKLLRDAPVLSA